MISSFNSNDIRAEIRTKEKTQCFDNIGTFWFAARQTELSKLFIRAKHDQFGTKYNSIMKELFKICHGIDVNQRQMMRKYVTSVLR